MTTVTVLPEAVRGSVNFGHVGDALPTPFHMAASIPQNFVFTFISSVWVNAGHTLGATLEASFDGGITWSGFGGFPPGPSGILGKGGVVNPPAMTVSWDGRAMDLRGSITVGPAPFSWGLTITSV